ncbi:TlpA family protein disulfide reductase [Aquipuribacter nitratireducens]|uniref:TlpA family protein disulfide reductase n=1 Tax=Aquipuribacter nitratireducens TaxID=650104 RepID=A0ABW0GUN8_9MICO
MRVRGAVAVGAAAATLLLGACTAGEAGVPGLRDEAARAYVSGDATVEVLPADDRGEPVDGVTGTTLDGEPLDVADLRGETVVLNVWGSWCAPCHAEAPDLVEAEAQLADEGVRFVGINIRDRSVEAAAGFEEEYGIGWPSLHDPDSLLLLPLAGSVPPNTVPATLVLDEEGRVAARILSRVDRATLVGVVEDVRGAAAAGR